MATRQASEYIILVSNTSRANTWLAESIKTHTRAMRYANLDWNQDHSLRHFVVVIAVVVSVVMPFLPLSNPNQVARANIRVQHSVLRPVFRLVSKGAPSWDRPNTSTQRMLPVVAKVGASAGRKVAAAAHHCSRVAKRNISVENPYRFPTSITRGPLAWLWSDLCMVAGVESVTLA